MREIIKVAEDCGVTYCVEAVNRFETCLINTAEEALSYVAEPVKNAVCSGIKTIAKGAKAFLHNTIIFVKTKVGPIRQTAHS